MVPVRPHWPEPAPETGPEALPLRIWRLRLGDLGAAPTGALRRLTIPSEHDRAQDYRFEDDRLRHLGGRALVRLFLSHACEGIPADCAITEGPHGKPTLAGDRADEAPVEFNIAHTDDVVVAAFSRAHPVGIDVEACDRDADLEGLAQRVFANAERHRWRALPDADRPDFFFQVWTCKEAFLKATGQGLRRAPATLECTFEGSAITGIRDATESPASTAPATRWDVRPFSLSDRILGAVVRKHTVPSSLTFADAGRLLKQTVPS